VLRHYAQSNDCFLSWLLGSQGCEAMFRTARSLNSIFSTVINFGMLGLLRLHCLHIQLALQVDSGEEDILLPRVARQKEKTLLFKKTCVVG